MPALQVRLPDEHRRLGAGGPGPGRLADREETQGDRALLRSANALTGDQRDGAARAGFRRDRRGGGGFDTRAGRSLRPPGGAHRQAGAYFFVNQNSREPATEPEEMGPLWKIFDYVGADWTYSSKGWAAENFCMFTGDDQSWRKMVEQRVAAVKRLGCRCGSIPSAAIPSIPCGRVWGASGSRPTSRRTAW